VHVSSYNKKKALIDAGDYKKGKHQHPERRQKQNPAVRKKYTKRSKVRIKKHQQQQQQQQLYLLLSKFTAAAAACFFQKKWPASFLESSKKIGRTRWF
jgi:hypothetical protein